MHGPEGDHQVRHWRAGHFYEYGERGVLRWAYDNPQYFERVVDVGACLGNHSVFFAGELGAKVFAIEPAPANGEYLKKNLSANNLWDRVQTRGYLIGPQIDYRLVPPPEGNVGMTRFERAGADELTKTGHFLAHVIGTFKPTAIKIDAEGMSLHALIASMGIVTIHRPLVIMEETDRVNLETADWLLSDHTRLPKVFNATATHVWIPS